MDILCPIGKGQRSLIVSPPKAGKTSLMKEIAMLFKKTYGASPSNAVLYNNFKDFEDLARNADIKYGGWFEFAKGNPDYEK